MIYTNLTNAELVRHVDNKPDATPLERELAQRLDEVTEEVKMVQALLDTAEAKIEEFEDGAPRG